MICLSDFTRDAFCPAEPVEAVRFVPSFFTYMDLKKKKIPRLLMQSGARRNFIFSFDIFDNWGREGVNLHKFQAHIKLRSVVFLKVLREVTTLN